MKKKRNERKMNGYATKPVRTRLLKFKNINLDTEMIIYSTLFFILLLIETSSLLLSLQDILIDVELLLVFFCVIAAISRFQFE
jgi:hypothetical protein